MGVNMSTQGRKFLFYLYNALLQRQLKCSYWQCGWCAHQKQVGWSRGLTLGIKHSNKLFHCVDEHGEFCGALVTGATVGVGRHGSCSAVKHRAHGVMDLFYIVWVIGEVIRKFELELVANLAPKLQQEATGKGVALLRGSKVVFHNKECGDGDEISVILS